MVSHLRVLNRGPLGETDILNLGRVNVICGRNNSGKSTLLTGICGNPAPIVGRQIVGDAELSLWRMALPTSQVKDFADHLHVRFREILQGVLAKQEHVVWFANQGEHFTQMAFRAYTESNIAQYGWNHVPVSGQFAQLFPELPKRLLVPAKRALGTTSSISSAEAVGPNGAGVLNRLFLWSNQTPGSVERGYVEDVRTAFKHISDGHSFFISQETDGNNLRLRFARDDNSWLDAESCGLGLQDLLVLLYFAHEPTASIIGIEEPESHLHPDMQRRLLHHLRNGTKKQYFLTTHSNVFLTPTLVDRVLFTTFERAITISDATRRAEILSDLGYSVTDNLAADLVVLVEGPSDKPVLEELFARFGLSDQFDIKIWPLGGDIMDQSDLSAFKAQARLLAVVDSDPQSGDVRQRFAQNCAKLGIPTFSLKRYAIENYFPLSAYQKVFKSQLPTTVTSLDDGKRIKDQLGFDVKRSNRHLAEATPTEYWKASDLADLVAQVRGIAAS